VTAETAPAGQDVVLLAHGSPDPRHARDVAALRGRVAAAAPHLRVRAAYLDHHGPSVGETARDRAGHDGEITLVPVLLTRAFHARVDIPAAATELSEGSGRCVRITDALGPDPLLARALEELLAQRSECQVVVFLAGSSRHEAVDELVAQLRADLMPERRYAFATLDDHLPLTTALRELDVRAGVVGVSAMIAEGVLRDRMVRRCAERGIPFAAGVLADTGSLTRLVLDRVDAPRS
jgi:sirohydrochlorin ferrochelatase